MRSSPDDSCGNPSSARGEQEDSGVPRPAFRTAPDLQGIYPVSSFRLPSLSRYRSASRIYHNVVVTLISYCYNYVCQGYSYTCLYGHSYPVGQEQRGESGGATGKIAAGFQTGRDLTGMIWPSSCQNSGQIPASLEFGAWRLRSCLGLDIVLTNNCVLTENVALINSGCYVLKPWVIS
jgi:hypothetical protein